MNQRVKWIIAKLLKVLEVRKRKMDRGRPSSISILKKALCDVIVML